MTVQGPRPLSTLNSILQSCRQRYVICRPLFFLPFGWQTKSSLGDGAGGNMLPSVGPELGGSRGSLMLCPNLIVIPEQHSTKSSSGIHRSREGAEPGHAELHKVGFIFKEMFPPFLNSFFFFFFKEIFLPRDSFLLLSPNTWLGLSHGSTFCRPTVAVQWWERDFLESCRPPRAKPRAELHVLHGTELKPAWAGHGAKPHHCQQHVAMRSCGCPILGRMLKDRLDGVLGNMV